METRTVLKPEIVPYRHFQYAETLITENEALTKTPYKDQVGKLTIGYGRNLENRGIRYNEAELMLANDIEESHMELKNIDFYSDLSDERKAVLIDMAHNLGFVGLIEKEATVTLWRQGTNMTTEFKSWVNHTEVALLYYACAESSEWKIDNTVYDVYPVNGLVLHKRPTECYSKLRIWIVAYNNFQKRTQKSAQMIWTVDMEKLISRHAAKGVRT